MVLRDLHQKRRIVMDKKVFAFDETYDLDNVYNSESDELYAERSGDSSVWYS